MTGISFGDAGPVARPPDGAPPGLFTGRRAAAGQATGGALTCVDMVDGNPVPARHRIIAE